MFVATLQAPGSVVRGRMRTPKGVTMDEQGQPSDLCWQAAYLGKLWDTRRDQVCCAVARGSCLPDGT